MRVLLSGCIGFLLLFSCNMVFGQAGLDTLGLTVGMGVLEGRLLKNVA